LAGIIRDYTAKGSLIYVEGKLQTRQWERDGQQQYTTEIVVNSIQLLSPKKDSYDSNVNQVKEHFDAKHVEEDDQIPF
jgi:single-strand DNA-binding protein